MSGHGPAAKGGRRRGGAHEEEHVNHERWLVSYSDMITVLMALFIVLFAISQVDQQKFIALRDSLSAGFGDGTISQAALSGTAGVMDGDPITAEVPTDGNQPMVKADAGNGQQASNPTASPNSTDPSTVAAAQAEAQHLADVREAIRAQLAASGYDGHVKFRVDERGLILGLVADDTFFAAGSAELTPTATQIVDSAAPVLVGLGEQISVEGHANILAAGSRYATNWELSSARATEVLCHLVESDGMPGNRIMAVGFGDQRPLVAGDSPDALAANRRVDLVVLSSAPEAVRALVPSFSTQG